MICHLFSVICWNWSVSIELILFILNIIYICVCLPSFIWVVKLIRSVNLNHMIGIFCLSLVAFSHKVIIMDVSSQLQINMTRSDYVWKPYQVQIEVFSLAVMFYICLDKHILLVLDSACTQTLHRVQSLGCIKLLFTVLCTLHSWCHTCLCYSSSTTRN